MIAMAGGLLAMALGLWGAQVVYQTVPAWEPPPLGGRLRWLLVLWTLERVCVYGALLLLLGVTLADH